VDGEGGCIGSAGGGGWVTMPDIPFSRIDPRTSEVTEQHIGAGGDCLEPRGGVRLAPERGRGRCLADHAIAREAAEPRRDTTPTTAGERTPPRGRPAQPVAFERCLARCRATLARLPQVDMSHQRRRPVGDVS
jgi:hypothetical protein